MSRQLKDLNQKERDKAEEIFRRSIDFENEEFIGGGSWEGGYEFIEFKDVIKVLEYFKSIGVKINLVD